MARERQVKVTLDDDELARLDDGGHRLRSIPRRGGCRQAKRMATNRRMATSTPTEKND
jgi:hypothetical protein